MCKDGRFGDRIQSLELTRGSHIITLYILIEISCVKVNSNRNVEGMHCSSTYLRGPLGPKTMEWLAKSQLKLPLQRRPYPRIVLTRELVIVKKRTGMCLLSTGDTC